ncbi:hypothetical protein SV7mr_30420 [Stieleria bergensis]|uniref:Uncharacterized protein n=1 Tax=Stieleria bergensis TaxID=2528025 RepID=A0A517SWK8_9BACT|nr:hypothetical protein SV7mr_30420 [Planctomycetes bacterium SV_7m_r]
MIRNRISNSYVDLHARSFSGDGVKLKTFFESIRYQDWAQPFAWGWSWDGS